MFLLLAAALGGFDVYSDSGRLHRIEGDMGASPVVSYRRSDDGGKSWTQPVAVDAARPAYRFGAGDARVVAEGDFVAALWARPGKGPMGSGPLAVSISRDGGKTWTAAASPADGGPFGRRFPALAISSGALHAVWLDRQTNAKVLASASRDGGKTWSRPATLDSDVCECCWNKALAVPGAVLALYRDKNPRDMGVAVSRDGGKSWGSPGVAGPFGWGINGCPHVGGGLAWAGGKPRALVWTGHAEKAGLYALTSEDGGATWGKPDRLGGIGAKHGDLAANGTRLGAVWDEDGAVWFASSADGASWTSPRRISSPKDDAGDPRIVEAGGGFRAFWIVRSGKDKLLLDAPLLQ